MPFKMKKAEDSVGHRFGKLIVVATTNQRIRRHIAVLCKCDCGGEGTFDLSQMKAGRINSCGCLKKEASLNHIRNAHETMFICGKWTKDPRIGTALTIYRSNHYTDGNMSFDNFLLLSQQDCFYCGIKPFRTSNRYNYPSRYDVYKIDRVRDGYFTYNGVDRIDSSQPHNMDNVVPCCYPCNIAKLQSTQENFFDQTKRRYEHLVSKGLIT
jgi:hypothetical protein